MSVSFFGQTSACRRIYVVTSGRGHFPGQLRMQPGVADRLDGGNAQPLRGKRQHLRRGGRWKGAHQQTKFDRIPHRAGCNAENSDSATAKTTCGV